VRTRDDRGRDDRGSATVWALAAGSVVVSFALAVAAVGAAIVSRHRAQAAADLAALAGALAALDGDDVACQRATVIATANGADLTGCEVEGLDVVVTVQSMPTLIGSARASARAGPVDLRPA
jgi:secretion/DNA translocation related TadE-like protein